MRPIFAFTITISAICCIAPVNAEEPRVRIGSKASIENIVLGELLTHLARHAGAKAEHRSALGGTQIAYQALIKGEIDVYTEYTGTLEREILEDERIRS